MTAMNPPLDASKRTDSVDSMGKPAHSMWHYRPTRLFSQTVSEASQSLQIDALEFNKAADAVAQAAAVGLKSPCCTYQQAPQLTGAVYCAWATVGPCPLTRIVCVMLQNTTTDVLLTADIGGTNCRFNLWAAKAGLDTQYEEIFNKVCASSLSNTAMSVRPYACRAS